MPTIEVPDVYIVSAVRTPIATFRGSFATLSSVDLGHVAVSEALNRSGVKPEDVDETIVGSVLTANHGQNVARQIAIKSGIPTTSLAFTVNKVCSSGLKAVMLASQSIQLGVRQVAVAAGTESMTQTPFYMPRTELVYGDVKMTDGIQKDGLTDAMLGQAMGICAEKTVKDYKLTREEQDKYAIQSYHRAAEAWKSGAFKEEVVPVTVKPRRGADVVISEDEEYKKLMEAKVPSLRPAFISDGTGTITAANASSINDGAAALVLASEGYLKENGAAKPLAKIVGFAEAGGDPVDFTIAPVAAVQNLLKKTGISKEQVAKWEVNEAFAVTILSFIRDLGLDAEKVNARGGAIALGHPIGMSGARIVVTLLHQLKEGEFGVAAICNGGGEATAVLIQRC
uniref:Acetyl-CoA acetyltransferase n=1 Tax=Steinernema glaseri TaxID=37863 RepID=A0A1I8ALW9_9BILA